jgi:uncharacterized membrane protein
MSGGWWSLMTILGPIVLAVAIAWAILNNRRSKSAEDRTEAATRQMYAEQNADDKAKEVR